MKLDNVEIYASPSFQNATCPKGHGDMVKLPNGWFSVCWYCEMCKYPYQLEMRKMRHVNEKNLTQLLEEEKSNN